MVAVTAFVASLIVFEEPFVSAGLSYVAMLLIGLTLLSMAPVFPARNKTMLMEVGLDGIRTPHTFIGFERLVSVQVSQAASPDDALLVLLTDNGDKLTLNVAGFAQEAVGLIEERRDIHAELTRTRKVSPDGYRNVRVQESVDGDLVDAMRDAGVGDTEMGECLALAYSGDAP